MKDCPLCHKDGLELKRTPIIRDGHLYDAVLLTCDDGHQQAWWKDIENACVYDEPENDRVVPLFDRVCVVCGAPRMVSKTGKQLTMCVDCQQEYWRKKKENHTPAKRKSRKKAVNASEKNIDQLIAGSLPEKHERRVSPVIDKIAQANDRRAKIRRKIKAFDHD